MLNNIMMIQKYHNESQYSHVAYRNAEFLSKTTIFGFGTVVE